MKIEIEGKDYEVSDECIASLLLQMRGLLTKGNVKIPPDIQAALDGVNSLTDESLAHLVQSIRDFGLKHYTGLSTPKKLTMMAGVRWLISQGEKKFGEVAQTFRPPKRSDPVEHAVSVVYPVVEKTVPALGRILPYVTIALSTNNTNVTDIRFSVKGETGGQVAADGDVREWQDNSGKTAEPEHSAALS